MEMRERDRDRETERQRETENNQVLTVVFELMNWLLSFAKGRVVMDPFS